MHTYRIFEVSVDEKVLFDTGKTVECDPPTFDNNGYLYTASNAPKKLCDILGFTSHFSNYFYAQEHTRQDKDIVISTNVATIEGNFAKRPIWHLKFGV